MVALGGDPGKTGHLRVTDRQGRITGWGGTGFVNEIPGAELREQLVFQRELVAPEPFAYLPPGGGYTIEHVDLPAGAQATTINVTGPDVGAALRRAGEGAALRLGAGGAVALSGAAGSELRLAAGDREVRLVPSADEVAVRPAGDDVRILGSVASAVAVDPATGESTPLRAP
jgi:hypothetical protein